MRRLVVLGLLVGGIACACTAFAHPSPDVVTIEILQSDAGRTPILETLKITATDTGQVAISSIDGGEHLVCDGLRIDLLRDGTYAIEAHGNVRLRSGAVEVAAEEIRLEVDGNGKWLATSNAIRMLR